MTHNAPENTRKARSLAVPVGAGSLAALTVLGLVPTAQAVGAETDTPNTDSSTSTTQYSSTEREISNTQDVLDTAKKAEEAGVKVTQKDDSVKNVSLSEADAAVADAETANASQIEKLNAAIEEQKQNDTEYDKAVADRNAIISQNETISADNAAAKKAQEEAQSAADAVKAENEKIAQLREEIKAANDAGLAAQVAADEAYETKVAEITAANNKVIEANNTSLESNRQRLADVTAAVSSADPKSDEYKTAVENYNKVAEQIKADNERIASENQAAIEKYQADLAAAEKARDEAIAKAVEVEAKNAELKAAYDAALADYNAKSEAYNNKLQAYNNLINALETGGTVVTEEFLDQCRAQNLAVVIDLTYSFGPNDYNKQFDAYRQFLTQMSQLPGTTVDVYFYGTDSAQNKDALDYDTPLSDQNFDISTPEGLAGAMGVLNKASSVDRGKDDNHGWFSSGTNWEAGLLQVAEGMKDTGRNYTNILFTSDGVPNKYLDDDGNWVETGTGGYDQTAADEALTAAQKILDGDTRITPVFIRTSEEPNLSIMALDGKEPGTLQKGLDAIGKLSGSTNPVLGEDYYSAESMDGLVGDLWKAAVADCRPNITAQPMPPNPDDYTPGDVPEIPEVNVPPTTSTETADVNVLANTPTAPTPFVPTPEPEDLDVPPVPEYNPVPKLTVPAEPVKKQAEVAVELSKVFVDPSDVRIDKVLVDSDASDGQVQYKVTVGNFGPGTAHQVAAEDFKFEGLKDVKISDVKSIADVTAETVEEVAAASDVTVDSARLMVTDSALAQNEGFSFIVTAQVEENVDVIANAARVTTPDDPEKGKEDGDPNANLTEDNDGFDNERQRIQGPVEVKVDKTLTDSDASDGYVEYTVTGKNVGPGIAKDVVVTDEPGAGIESIEITGVQVTPSGAKDAVTIDVPASESTEAPADPSASPSATPSAETTATAEPSAEPSSVAGTVNKGATTQPVAPVVAAAGDSSGVAGVAQGSEVSVAIPGFVDKAKVDIKGITGVGPVKAVWNGDGFLIVSAASDADLGDAVVAYSLTLPDGSVTEASMTVTVVGANDSGIVVNPPAVPSADPGATPETGAPETGDSLVNTDVADVSDVTVTENGVTIGAMGAGEVVTLTVKAKVADNVDTIDNVARINTPSDPTKGEDGEPNATVDEDTDGYDRDRNKVKRPADLRINKQVVDADASDGYIDYVIEGANFGPGIAEQVVITDETVAGLDGVEITGVEVIPAENLVAQPSVDELGVVSTDVSVVDDYTIDGSTVAIDAMGAGERVKVSVTAKVTEGAELVENDARITSPSDPTKGEGDQTNNSVDDDEDGFDKELTNIDQPVDLRVVKTAVDDNAEDGQVTFEVEGKNFGTGTATEVVVEDLESDVKNLEDLKISNVVVSDNTDFTVDGTSVKLPALAGGQSVRFTVTADVVDATQEMSNSASITSPDSDKTRDDQDNGTLEEDQDGWDVVSIPGVPAPETPVDPENPADPANPADPGAPADPAQPSSEAPVKGTWGTGAGGVAGIGVGAAAILALGAYAVSRFRGRSAE